MSKALAEVKAHQATIQEKDELIKLLTKERDQALATLNRHGILADRNIQVFIGSVSVIFSGSCTIIWLSPSVPFFSCPSPFLSPSCYISRINSSLPL